MKKTAITHIQLLRFILFFNLILFGGLGSATALDTAVVGQPYPYYGGYYGAPYGPYAYPGGYGAYDAAVVDNPNPALNPGPANPFFLSTMAGRGSPYWGSAPGTGRFILNNPGPGR